jgi:hypothetical protein
MDVRDTSCKVPARGLAREECGINALTLVDPRTTGSGRGIHVYPPTGRPEFGCRLSSKKTVAL